MSLDHLRLPLLGALLAIVATLLPAGSARAADFGVEVFDGGAFTQAGGAFTQAGGHPYDVKATFRLNTEVSGADSQLDPAGGKLKDVTVSAPPGLIGNPTAVPQCPSHLRPPVITDAEYNPELNCPLSSIVGMAAASFAYPGPFVESGPAPVFNVAPPPGAAAAFAFDIQGSITYIIATLREDDYGVDLRVRNVSSALNVIGSEVTLWGNPADPSHNDQRCIGLTQVGVEFIEPSCSFFGTNAPGTPLGPNPAGYAPEAFLANPTACTPGGEGLQTGIRVTSYNHAAAPASAGFESHLPPGYTLSDPQPAANWGPPQGPSGCADVPFDPVAELAPTMQAADSSTGLAVDISVPTRGLEDPAEISQSHLKKAVVTFPEGMSVNPSSANGLGSCSPAQLDAEEADSPPGAGCPDSSKIGTVEVDTPLLDETLTGSVFLAKQNDNPFNSLLALYIVVRSPQRGVILKLPGRVDPDPVTGRLTATFDDNPQLPFSELRLRLKDGPRAPLITPRQCGSYEIETELYPWARPGEPVRHTSEFEVTSGPNGSPCPAGGQFDPGFEAGTLTPIAGAYSPLIVNASRPEGSAPLAGLTIDLPEGLLAKLAGVPYCPEAALVAAAGKTGAAELGSPSCPAASRIGSVDVGAGAGSLPFHVKGAAYLAGPYRGAPLSIATITPALAGPFDLGTVVVRARAEVDPRTARIHVASDPIPQILQGIPLQVRSISVDTDRPGFTLNPTGCDPTLFGGTLLAASASRAVASPFQVGACRALGFKPRLSLRLKGATKRSGNPALTAVLRQNPGGANIERASVAMPKSEFLAQEHIRTICTRVQFAARSCPKGSVYGRAAAFSPLLDQPLRGPVYLRSSDNELPDLVADLRGQIDIELVGRIDSFRRGIRTTFDTVPDAPVSKFVLKMKGGKWSLLKNSVNLCRSTNRATVRLKAQNGLSRNFQLPVRAAGCGKKKRR